MEPSPNGLGPAGVVFVLFGPLSLALVLALADYPRPKASFLDYTHQPNVDQLPGVNAVPEQREMISSG